MVSDRDEHMARSAFPYLEQGMDTVIVTGAGHMDGIEILIEKHRYPRVSFASPHQLVCLLFFSPIQHNSTLARSDDYVPKPPTDKSHESGDASKS